MEVLLQYWDELDDLWHAGRFWLREGAARLAVYGTALMLLGIGVPVGG